MNEYEDIRLLVESFYDQQEVRKESANRIRTIIRNRLEKADFRVPESSKDDKDQGKWTDNNMKIWIKLARSQDKISDDDEKYLNKLLDLKHKMAEFEKEYKSQLLQEVRKEPIFKDYLVKIWGAGELTAANLIAFIGYCGEFETVSKLWRYAGLGMRPICKNCNKYIFDNEKQRLDWIKRHEARASKDKKDFSKYTCTCSEPQRIEVVQRRVKGLPIDYNPKLKTYMYRWMSSVIKAGYKVMEDGKKRPGGYRRYYDQFKKKYREVHPKEIDNPRYLATKQGTKKKYTDGHINTMTMRKVEKMFLQHYWMTARQMKGLPTRKPYPMDHGHTGYIEPFTDE